MIYLLILWSVVACVKGAKVLYHHWPHKDMPQMRRFFLSPRKWRWRLYLHHTVRSDQDRDPHDHPWPFWSLMLWGSWTEQRFPLPYSQFQWIRIHVRTGSLVHRHATDIHQIEIDRPSWTLVLAGPWERRWGFYTVDGFVGAAVYK